MSDYIDRQTAIDAIIKKLCIKDESYLLPSEKDIVDTIKEVPSAQQWIPVSSGNLPKKGQEVLVTRASGQVEVVTWDPWFGKQQLYNSLRPIAWMPSPKPWKGEE